MLRPQDPRGFPAERHHQAVRFAHDQAADPFLAAVTLWASLHGLVILQVTRLAFPWPPLADMIARIAGL